MVRYGQNQDHDEHQNNWSKSLYAEYLADSHQKNILDSLTGGSICLDIGCGEGNQIRLLRPYFNCTIGTDLSFTALSMASERYNGRLPNKSKTMFLQADGFRQPFKSESFDFILCSEVVEHILPEESPLLLKEIGRLLKKNGRCLITTPNRWEYRRRFFDLPIYLLAAMTGNNLNFIKSKLFRSYLKLSGASCTTLNAMEKHEFTEHINILSPKELEAQIKAAGLTVAQYDVQYLYPPILGPFHKSLFLVKTIKRIERYLKNSKFRFYLFGGLVFLCSKSA
ncbi:MAG: class I SAM-dependent methyltransferase [candidate division KSB1 bacterium]|nr:class I SAM-dependent methyltransferase [candidate division KSB1 bacterium]MDZ7319506.1 class I SAM-dependent methyltransferase [candidate division KSB1 bacterium]